MLRLPDSLFFYEHERSQTTPGHCPDFPLLNPTLLKQLLAAIFFFCYTRLYLRMIAKVVQQRSCILVPFLKFLLGLHFYTDIEICGSM